VGVIEPGADANLLQESLGAQCGGQLGPEHLERHFAIVLQIASEIHRRHPAGADLTLQRVAVPECLAERRGNVGQKVPPMARDGPNLRRFGQISQ